LGLAKRKTTNKKYLAKITGLMNVGIETIILAEISTNNISSWNDPWEG